MGERETFDRIVASLQDAAMDDARWPAASALIDDALGVHGNCMALCDLHSGGDLLIHFLGFFFRGQRRHEFEREYHEVYYPLDERVPRAPQYPDGRLFHISELYTEEERKSSLVYNEFSPRMHARNSINIRLNGPGGSSIFWAINDPVGGDWSSARLDSLRRLLPHVRRYVSVRQALAGAGALGASLAELLEATGAGVIQLDRRGRILEANDRARGLLRAGDGLIDEGGFVFAGTPEDDLELQGLLARALPPYGTQGVGGTAMASRASDLPLVVHVHPVGRREADFHVWPVAALVLIVDPARGLRIDPAVAGSALGLTGMESRVAVLLAEGMSVGEVAEALGREESTIRSHVKGIFARHGLSRQAELVRLVLSLAGSPEPRD